MLESKKDLEQSILATRRQTRRTIKEANNIVRDYLTGGPTSFSFSQESRRRIVFATAQSGGVGGGTYDYDRKARISSYSWLARPNSGPEIFAIIKLRRSPGRVRAFRKHVLSSERLIDTSRFLRVYRRAGLTGNSQRVANLLDSLPGADRRDPFSTAVRVGNGDFSFA